MMQATPEEHIKTMQAIPVDTPRATDENPTQTTQVNKLSPTPTILSQFQTGYAIGSVVCLSSGQTWLADTSKLQLMNGHGKVKDTLHTDFDINDIILSPLGHFLLSDVTNSCIKTISQDKKVRTLFKTQIGWFKPKILTPWGLSALHSGYTAVTFPNEGRVIIYSMSGKVVKELDKKLFSRPVRVAQSRINNDLYIVDKAENGPVGAGKVLVVDKHYKVRYEYNGTGDKEFRPMGLCTDYGGHVLIVDYNDRVHILDKSGHFIQYLLTGEQGLEWPFSVSVDSEGNAWVGERCGGVKVVKYLQEESSLYTSYTKNYI